MKWKIAINEEKTQAMFLNGRSRKIVPNRNLTNPMNELGQIPYVLSSTGGLTFTRHFQETQTELPPKP